MFPKITESTKKPKVPLTKMGKSFLFDFDTGEFIVVDGKVSKCVGIDAVKVWIKKALNTEKFKFKIYETCEYGVCLKDFINGDYPLAFVQIEVEREVKETLIKNVDITSINNFQFSQNGRNLICSFTVETIYGKTGGEITI